jgi:hypothetical protein
MDIFHVNMPLLYGEGQKAFTRLQEEIIKVSEDYSIFAWQAHELSHYQINRGLLAIDPSEFHSAANIVPLQTPLSRP